MTTSLSQYAKSYQTSTEKEKRFDTIISQHGFIPKESSERISRWRWLNQDVATLRFVVSMKA